MKMFLLLLLTGLLFPFLQGCGANDTPNYECTPDITIPFPQDALDRFYFKSGTWWVYEEINNPGMEDSVWVIMNQKNTSSPDESVFGQINTQKCYDNHITSTKSARFGEIKCWMQIKDPYDGFDYSKEFFEIIEQPKGSEPIYRLTLEGKNYKNENSYGDKISLIDSISTQLYTHYNALHFEKTQSLFDYLQEAWYIKNIGLVKFERVDGSEWELVRYSIVQ